MTRQLRSSGKSSSRTRSSYAASKFMQIPDIDYMYNPDIFDLTFSCKGLIF